MIYLKKRILISLPIFLVIIFSIIFSVYENNFETNIELNDVSGDRKHIEDIDMTSLFRINMRYFTKLQITDSKPTLKSISSTSFVKESEKLKSYNLFGKYENTDLLNRFDYYSDDISFSDGKFEGIVGVENVSDDKFSLNISIKDLQNNNINKFKLDAKKSLKDTVQYNFSTILNNDKLYVFITFFSNEYNRDNYSIDSAIIDNNVYCIDIKNKTIKHLLSEQEKLKEIGNNISFSYKNSMYTLVTNRKRTSDNVKREYILYKYDINNNYLEKINFYDIYLKNSNIDDYYIVNSKMQKNKINILFKNDKHKFKIVSINLDDNSVKTIDCSIDDDFFYENDINYFVNVLDFYVLDDKSVLLNEIDRFGISIFVFDNNEQKNLYSGYINYPFYPDKTTIKVK